jgi:hypothetical protein
MTNTTTYLPADKIDGAGRPVPYTSPTNIGALMWSTLAARELGIITDLRARALLDATLDNLGALQYHLASGQFFNWYDPASRQPTWPPDDKNPGHKFISSVDNGWLAAALMMVKNARPVVGAGVSDKADAILRRMDFKFYYDAGKGLLRNGAFMTEPDQTKEPTARENGVWWKASKSGDATTISIYGELNTEPRMATYIGIARNGVPKSAYYKLLRTPRPPAPGADCDATPKPAGCDQEMIPDGGTATYEGVEVYEGHYQYNFFNPGLSAWLGIKVVPSHGGSMFEALMVPLFVPEERWAPKSWGRNHPCYVRAQIDHGLTETDYGYWGFSPSNDPFGGYREYGVDALGISPGKSQPRDGGYFSDEQNTNPNYMKVPPQRPQNFGNGVVTPHASFLALKYDRPAAVANLDKLKRDFPRVYDWGGFYDAAEVRNGRISEWYLSLDQGMVMAAIANTLTANRFSGYFWSTDTFAETIEPLIAQEEFSIPDWPACVVD